MSEKKSIFSQISIFCSNRKLHFMPKIQDLPKKFCQQKWPLTACEIPVFP